jgi:hypothetical protein
MDATAEAQRQRRATACTSDGGSIAGAARGTESLSPRICEQNAIWSESKAPAAGIQGIGTDQTLAAWWGFNVDPQHYWTAAVGSEHAEQVLQGRSCMQERSGRLNAEDTMAEVGAASPVGQIGSLARFPPSPSSSSHLHSLPVFTQPTNLPFAMPEGMMPPPLIQNTEIYAPRANSAQPNFYSLFRPPPGHNNAYDRHFVGERGAGLGTSINTVRREARWPSR